MNRVFAKFIPVALMLGAMAAGMGLASQAANAQGRYYGDFPNTRHELVWSGNVDDTTIVSLRGSDIGVRDVRGNSSTDVHSRLFGYLPDRPVTVFIKRFDGRGNVEVVRQPNANNNYTAVVRIKDPQPGRGHYNFVLGWGPGGNFRGF